MSTTITINDSAWVRQMAATNSHVNNVFLIADRTNPIFACLEQDLANKSGAEISTNVIYVVTVNDGEFAIYVNVLDKVMVFGTSIRANGKDDPKYVLKDQLMRLPDGISVFQLPVEKAKNFAMIFDISFKGKTSVVSSALLGLLAKSSDVMEVRGPSVWAIENNSGAVVQIRHTDKGLRIGFNRGLLNHPVKKGETKQENVDVSDNGEAAIDEE